MVCGCNKMNCCFVGLILVALVTFPAFADYAVPADAGLTFVSPVGEWNGRELKCDKGAAAFAKRMRNAKSVARVVADVSALGCFEFYVNGKLVSVSEGENRRDYLRPGASDCQKRRFYLTYDITSLWSSEAEQENTVSAFVARSWFSDFLGGRVDVKPAFGARIKLSYADGTSEIVKTDTSWEASFDAPFLRAGIYFGEVYDARVCHDAAKCAGDGRCEINSEFKGVVSPHEGPGISLRRDLAMVPGAAYSYRGVVGAADDAFGRVAEIRRWDGGSAFAMEPGERLVVDFGQNAAAVPEIVATAEKGVTLCFKGAEMLNDSNGEKSRGNDGPGGSVYRANLRKLKDDGALVKYIFAGKGIERYVPSFTFMGYRYAEISATGPVVLHEVKSIPVTSVAKSMERGRVTTGNAAVNKLVSNVRWGMYSNYLSVPTDCPQRDERLGWTGDARVFAPAAFRVADVCSFMAKYMTDMRDAQDERGRFPSFAPRQYWMGAYGRFGWADAGIAIPWTTWRMSGDTSIVDVNWDSMSRFADFQANTRYKTKLSADGAAQYGDWLSFEDLEKGSKEQFVCWEYLAGCHWLRNARMMADMANATGRIDDSERFVRMADEARKSLKDEFFKDGGSLPVFLRDMQTPQLFALYLGLYDDQRVKDDAVRRLSRNIASHGGCLQTGFLGTAIILDALTYGAGRPDLAYSLLLQRAYPSWLYSVDNGATTIWERWNSYTKDKGFGPVGMNSFNHYAYGAVLDWIYGTAAGIRPGKDGGFDGRFTLAPIPDERLGSMHAEYRTKSGVILSDWRYEGGSCHWHFEVPEGSVATVTFNGVTADYEAGKYDATATVPARVVKARVDGRNSDWHLFKWWHVRELYAGNPETIDRTWKGPEDLSAAIWVGREGDALRVKFEVRDDKHVQRESAEKLYINDGLQFILESPTQSGNFEIGLARTEDGRLLLK